MGETVGQVVTLTDFHCLDEFNGKSFGLRNTPATFQRLMNNISENTRFEMSRVPR